MSADLVAFLTDPAGGWAFILPLWTAHLLFDFPLQPTRWVEQRLKRGWASGYLYLHAGLSALGAYAAASLALATLSAWWLLPLVFVSHVLIDGVKARTADHCSHFAIDQLAHFVIVLLSGFLLTRAFPEATPRGGVLWLAATVFLLVWWTEGSLIEKATMQWRTQLRNAGKGGLAKGGLWIGRLERSLIVLFVLTGRYEAIGFLIAAKSVLRFGDVSRPNQRGESEYILVGTLASFLLAVLTGLGAKYILGG